MLFSNLLRLPFSADPAHLYPEQNSNDPLIVFSTDHKRASQQKKLAYTEVMLLILYYTLRDYSLHFF